MDPTSIAALALGWACTLVGQPGQWTVLAMPVTPVIENRASVTIQGDPSFRGKVRVIRGEVILGLFDLKKIRAHPETDVRLLPGDVLQLAEPVF